MNIKLIFASILAIFFILLPIYSFLIPGPFSWHVAQSEAWQGGLEVLILFVFFYYALLPPYSLKKFLCFVLPAALYSRRHGIDLSIISLYLYIEAIFSIGWRLLPFVGGRQINRLPTYYLAAVVGLTGWLLTIWLFSALGFGSVKSIQIVTIVILGLALLSSDAPKLIFLLSPWVRVKKSIERASISLIAALFFALFAKTSSHIDFDSMWYGLQLEKTILGEGNIFASQGLVAMVYYYPKLYDSLLIPFSGLDSTSLPMGVAVFSWLMVVLTTFAIMREFRVNLTLSIIVMSLVATIPALGNIAITTKGDAFAAWQGLLGVLFLSRYKKTKDTLWFWVSLFASLFAILSRLSTLPYIVILIVFLIFNFIKTLIVKQKKILIRPVNLIFPTFASCLVSLVFFRTIHLAGVPFVAPEQLVNLANYLGMHVKFPVGGMPSSTGRMRIPFFWGLWSYLFSPANFGVLLITWIGNVWAYLPLVAVALSSGWKKAFSKDKLHILVIGLAFPLVLFIQKYIVAHGADGNYFIFPIICILIFSAFMLNECFHYVEKWLGKIMLVFAISSSAIIFITGDWGPGTRAIDLNFKRMPFELSNNRDEVIRNEKIKDIFNYFKSVPITSRVIGLESNLQRDFPLGWWLPVRYEPIEIISWSRPELLSSAQNFKDYIVNAKIDYLLVSRTNPNFSKNSAKNIFDQAINILKEEKLAEKSFENNGYEIWEFSRNSFPIKSEVDMKHEGKVDIYLASGSSCANQANLQVKVKWSFPNIVGVHVEVKAAKSIVSSVWLEAGNQGESITGPWVGINTEFVFKDIANNTILAESKVISCDYYQ